MGQILVKDNDEESGAITKGCPLLPPEMTVLQNAYTEFYKLMQKGK